MQAAGNTAPSSILLHTLAPPLEIKLSEAFESAKLYKILNTLFSVPLCAYSGVVLDTLGQGYKYSYSSSHGCGCGYNNGKRYACAERVNN